MDKIFNVSITDQDPKIKLSKSFLFAFFYGTTEVLFVRNDKMVDFERLFVVSKRKNCTERMN